MQVELNYGRRGLPVELPGDLQVTVVRKPVMPVLTNPVAAVRRAFQDPLVRPRWTIWRAQHAARRSRSATSRARYRTICSFVR
jgi:hypothetical protein